MAYEEKVMDVFMKRQGYELICTVNTSRHFKWMYEDAEDDCIVLVALRSFDEPEPTRNEFERDLMRALMMYEGSDTRVRGDVVAVNVLGDKAMIRHHKNAYSQA